MIRRRLAAAAVRLYPTDLRSRRGAEMLATALDAGDASERVFLLELWSLGIGGLRARCHAALRQPPQRAVFEAIGWAAIVLTAMQLLRVVVDQLQHQQLDGPVSKVLVADIVPALVLVLFSAGRIRAAGVLGCGWSLVRFWVGIGGPWVEFPAGLRFALLPAVGFGLLALKPAEKPDAPRWLWLLPAATFALLSIAQPFGWAAQAPVFAPILLALLMLPIWPTVALGTALVWSYAGAWNLAVLGPISWPTVVLLASLPLASTLAGLGRYATRPR